LIHSGGQARLAATIAANRSINDWSALTTASTSLVVSPVAAIRAANEDRAAVVPVFLRAIEEYLASPGSGSPAAASRSNALFFVFHLLGQWREKAAYRLLTQLLRRPRDEIDVIFGGAITETTHRVMAAVFDGDPAPLYDVILDPKAEDSIRSRMIEALAMVTLRGELPREEAGRFLRACYAELEPQEENFAWDGWQCAIAMLGLAELKPQVEQAFARGFINNAWLEFKHFERDLQHAIDHPGAPPLHGPDNEYTLFGDTIEELSGWYSFRPKPAENDDSTSDDDDGGARRPLTTMIRAAGTASKLPWSTPSGMSAAMIPARAAAAASSRNAASTPVRLRYRRRDCGQIGRYSYTCWHAELRSAAAAGDTLDTAGGA